MGDQGTQDCQSKFPRANKSWKSRRESCNTLTLLSLSLFVYSIWVKEGSPGRKKKKKKGILSVFQYLSEQKIDYVFIYIFAFSSFGHYSEKEMFSAQRKILLIYFISPSQYLLWFARDLQLFPFFVLFCFLFWNCTSKCFAEQVKYGERTGIIFFLQVRKCL